MFDTMDDLTQQQAADVDNAAPTEPAQPSKKQKVKRKSKGSQLSAMNFEASRQFAATITTCSPAEQADWLFNDYNKYGPKAETSIDEPSLQSQLALRQTAGLDESCIIQLPPNQPIEQQLKAIEPNWRLMLSNSNVQSRPTGSPSMLVLSSAAMGAVNFIKACPDLNRGCRFMKLFAKHIKVEEQVDLLKNSVVCVGAGTPNRVLKLIDSGALKLDKLKYVLLDVQLDAKQRTILDIHEVRADWWMLYNKYLKQLVLDGGLKIGLFKLGE